VGVPLKVVNCSYDQSGNYVCYLEGLVCPSTYSASYTSFNINLPSGLDYNNAMVTMTITTYLNQGSCNTSFEMSIGFGINSKCSYDLKVPYVPGKSTVSNYNYPQGSLSGCFQEGSNTVSFYSPALGALCFPWAVICAKIQAYVIVPPTGASPPPSPPPLPSPTPCPSGTMCMNTVDCFAINGTCLGYNCQPNAPIGTTCCCLPPPPSPSPSPSPSPIPSPSPSPSPIPCPSGTVCMGTYECAQQNGLCLSMNCQPGAPTGSTCCCQLPPSPSPPSPSPSPPPSAPPPPPPPSPSPSPVNWWLLYGLVLLTAIAIGAAVGVTASSR